MKYLLHGQNGTGKSTILRAIKERIIPGLQSNVTISLLQQREEGEIAEGGSDDEKEEKRKEELTALELVVQSDEIRMDALRKRKRE